MQGHPSPVTWETGSTRIAQGSFRNTGPGKESLARPVFRSRPFAPMELVVESSSAAPTRRASMTAKASVDVSNQQEDEKQQPESDNDGGESPERRFKPLDPRCGGGNEHQRCKNGDAE